MQNWKRDTDVYRTIFWTLWEKARVGCFKRTASKHVYYLGWNRSPAQAGCMRQVLGPGALGRPRGMGWGGRREGGSGWGTHVNPWLIHVNVWQKPLQYCKVISLQLIKISEKIIIIKWVWEFDSWRRGEHRSVFIQGPRGDTEELAGPIAQEGCLGVMSMGEGLKQRTNMRSKVKWPTAQLSGLGLDLTTLFFPLTSEKKINSKIFFKFDSQLCF